MDEPLPEQKFKRGDIVRVAEDLGPFMAHFRAGADAIILGSYRDLYGGAANIDQYQLMWCDTGGSSAWYYTHQLTFLSHGGEEEIARVTAAREAREEDERDLEWIVVNWPEIRDKVPGASMDELMRRVGISTPWGSRGEGVTYCLHAMKTFTLLDPVMSTGDLAAVEEFIATFNKKTNERKT